MKAEKVIKTVLAAHAGTAALVGTRIYPVLMPQEPTYPCITYRQVDSSRLQGVQTNPGVARIRLQVTGWAKTYEETKSLAEQIRLALERYGSAITGTTIAGVVVYDIFMGSGADAYEPELDVFALSTDFTVVHEE
jgi:hypothetical protein